MAQARLPLFSSAVAAALVLVALAASACGGKNGAPRSPADADIAATPAEVVAAGKAALEQYRQGYEVRSLEALAPLYDHGDALVVVQQGQRVVGWAAVEARLTTILLGATDVRVKAKDISVADLGSGGAVVNAMLTRELSDGVTTVEDAGPITLVLRRAGERWVIVGEHYSFAAR